MSIKKLCPKYRSVFNWLDASQYQNNTTLANENDVLTFHHGPSILGANSDGNGSNSPENNSNNSNVAGAVVTAAGMANDVVSLSYNGAKVLERASVNGLKTIEKGTIAGAVVSGVISGAKILNGNGTASDYVSVALAGAGVLSYWLGFGEVADLVIAGASIANDVVGTVIEANSQSGQ